MTEKAFVRGAPLPHWAEPVALPPVDMQAGRPPVLVRLADTQLWTGGHADDDPPSYLVQRAEQVNDAGALSQMGQLTVQFNPHFQRLLLHRVCVLRDDHTHDHTATLAVRFLQREAGLEQGVESGVVTATMVLPDLRVGDTLLLVYTVQGENPIFAGHYAGWAGWDQSHPVALRHVMLVAPEARRIHWRWIGDRPGDRPVPTERVHDGLRRLRFEGHRLPAVPFEPYLPRDAHPLCWLQFSEFDSWAEVAQWARALFPPDAPLPPALDAQMQRLATLPSPEEQVGAALQWVQQEIRYHSVSLGESSHKPHRPDEVVAHRYGDCKDKSLLLARMLQALGIEAHPALVAAQSRQAPLKLLPSPEAFDHVIVQVRLNGRDHYLDATRLGQSGALEHMGQGMEDAAVLVVAPGTTHLARVQSPNRAQLFGNELHERYVVTALDAPVQLQSEQHWYGLGAESLRAMLARMNDAQLAQWALGRYERRHHGIRLDEAPEVRHDAQRNRLSVLARYRLPGALQVDGEVASLAFTATNLHGVFVLPEGLARTLPLAVPGFPGCVQYTVEVRWPDGTVPVDAAGSERLDGRHFQLERRRERTDSTWREHLTLQPCTAAVPAAELQQLADDLRRLDRAVHGRLHAHRLALSAAVRAHPQDERLAEARCLRADTLLAQGEAAAAMAEAEAALRLAAALPRAWACRAAVHWQLGRLDLAADDLAQAARLARAAARQPRPLTVEG